MTHAAGSRSNSAPTELEYLNGKSVLVRFSRDRHNPPAAMRGTLDIRSSADGPVVQIALEFPQMFTARAHHQNIPLDDAAVAQLRESEVEGTFAITVDERLIPVAPVRNE